MTVCWLSLHYDPTTEQTPTHNPAAAHRALRRGHHGAHRRAARRRQQVVGVNKNTAALYFHKLREAITEHLADEGPFDGEVEIDESYFGGYRKGKRGRGAAGKVVVLDGRSSVRILKRGGKVYTAVPADLKRATLMPIIRQQVAPDSVVFTDGLRV